MGVFTVPAFAETTEVVYGYAWGDGEGHLRIVPRSAAFVHEGDVKSYRLKALTGAKELRLGYTGAAFGRVTVACDLKETEGQVALDAKGLGRTGCAPRDLDTELDRGPVPLRIEYAGRDAVRINEFLVTRWPAPQTARGTIKRVDDSTVVFASGGKRVKLGYTYATSFHRTTARCRDGWLAGRPVNAGRDGLGRKSCTPADLTRALKATEHPVLVQLDYTPGVGAVNEVWEVFGDA
ncbi:hypothetical protein FH608_031630 [Nonomuraea phyllanthi]|uniref:Uncharacterized protein n=1 Tax=Nonomuraea phyllanthi TaxID=2219224 RepID=A0A5C4VJK6_9ACTN|nr:hypothetical protein [Nonomuraea phyllanthi]KAB8191158.1 hypothetical protein FH608_031630 [Nonomuraea phyllanthi]QFY12782.1 hypothetical protein GBF35_44975 [Nonomuraea phyllanthi]